jgi:REP element-mobilizing transposase RayT
MVSYLQKSKTLLDFDFCRYDTLFDTFFLAIRHVAQLDMLMQDVSFLSRGVNSCFRVGSMSRALRVEFPGAIYHAMARGVAKMPVLLDEHDYLCLLKQIELQVEAGTLIVHCFCLLMNHIHLLCETPFGGMSRWMQQILGNYARDYNRRHNRPGHLWQGRYKAILVQDGQYLIECSQYIHLNPYRANIVTSLEDYPWSSYHNYCGGWTIVPWVSTDQILSHFGSSDDYQRYVEAGKRERQSGLFTRSVANLVLGDQEFVRRIRALAKRRLPHPEVPAHRALLRASNQISIEEMAARVEAAFSDLTACQRRRVLVWMLSKCKWLKACEIARLVGLRPNSVSVAIRSVESRRLINSEFALRLAALDVDDVVSPRAKT